MLHIVSQRAKRITILTISRSPPKIKERQNLKVVQDNLWENYFATQQAHRKSHLVIICPNSHEKLTKSEIR